MALCYKNLWKLLIDRDMTRKDLHRVSGVSHATLAKMSRGESVTAGIYVVIANEIMPDFAATLAANRPEVKVINEDSFWEAA